MKQFLKRWHTILALAFLLLTAFAVVSPLHAAPTTTRASQFHGLALGMGALLHQADYLRDFPGSRTAILSYFKVDSMDVLPLIRGMHIQTAIQANLNRDFSPQIALETERLSLPAFTKELSRRGSSLDRKLRLLASKIAQYRPDNKWFFIRPFSEMNDGTVNNPWELGNPVHHNTPADLATAWKLLRRVFNEEGATNALFIFSPLVANGVHGENDVLAALNKIPVGDIDCFSMNLYSRPRSAYGGKGTELIAFADLAQPWLNVLARSRHQGIPLAIAEMAVSSQASDGQRAKWLREAFQFGRTHGFVMMTYFNFPHRYWEIHAETWAGITLAQEINRDILNTRLKIQEDRVPETDPDDRSL